MHRNIHFNLNLVEQRRKLYALFEYYISLYKNIRIKEKKAVENEKLEFHFLVEIFFHLTLN